MDQADALAARDFVPQLDVGDNPPRDHAGDEPHPDFLLVLAGSEPQQQVFILLRRFALERAQKLPGVVPVIVHLPTDGGVLDMHIYHREKDGNPLAAAAHELRFIHLVDDIHFAMRRGHNQARPGGHAGVGIAEEIEREHRKQNPETNQEKGKRPRGDEENSRDKTGDEDGN